MSIKRKIRDFLVLGKARLSLLVSGTASTGYLVGSVERDTVTSKEESDHQLSSSFWCASMVTGGVFMTSMAASSLNQWIEVPVDSLMRRTAFRPMVTGSIGSMGALLFASFTAATGTSLLLQASDSSIPAALAFANIALYAGIYTPMKLKSVHSTSVGALVGALPPVIGFLAGRWRRGSNRPIDCLANGTGRLLSRLHLDDILKCLGLGSMLYCWQFPHFNALSWRLRDDYARAGFRMAAVVSHSKLFKGALRHSILLIPVSLLMSLDMSEILNQRNPRFSTFISNLTNHYAAAISLSSNIVLLVLAIRFKKNPSLKSSSDLFRYTLVHLPVLMACVISPKKTIDLHGSGNSKLLVSTRLLESG